MRTGIDVSSWQGIVTTLLGLVLVSAVAVGIRLAFMQRVQRRRERENRQINERLRTLIAAYKTLGGSFTGDLEVDPTHLRDLKRAGAVAHGGGSGDGDRDGVGSDGTGDSVDSGDSDAASARPTGGSERRRRVRDAVEAALSDVILLGTEPQVRLAVQAARDMVAGRPIRTAALVASLRDFVREALDLEPMPGELAVPDQGPARGAAGGSARGGRAARPSPR